jgi:hypothetical protein
MSKITLTLDRLKEFLQYCYQVFATRTEVEKNSTDLKENVLEITEKWYQDNLSFPSIEDITTGTGPEQIE